MRRRLGDAVCSIGCRLISLGERLNEFGGRAVDLSIWIDPESVTLQRLQEEARR